MANEQQIENDDANRREVSSTSPAPDAPVTPSNDETPSFREVAEEAYKKASGQDGTETPPSKSVTDPDAEQAEEMEEPPKPVGQEEQVEPVKPEPDPDANLPFHDHPRWKEVTQQRKDFEQRATQAEQRVKEWEPLQKQQSYHQDFCRRFGITDQEVASMMSYLATKKTDPAKARELLAPEWTELSQYDPDRIPPDIQKLIDENEMTPAAGKEFARVRAQLNAQQRSSQLGEAQRQNATTQATARSVIDWSNQMQGKDPDFRPKAKADDPSGLFEQTAANFAMLQTLDYATTPEKAVQHLEKAYKDAKATITRYAGLRSPTPKRPTTTRSSTVPNKKKSSEMSIREVVAATAAEHGISFDPTPPSDEE